MSSPESSETPTIICPNCGRRETRTEIRFCPNCGATLPGWTRIHPTASGFGALAQATRNEEPDTTTHPDRTQPVLKPIPDNPSPDSAGKPHQPWSPPEAPTPYLTGEQQRPSRKIFGALGGCLAVIGIVGIAAASIMVLLFLGLLLICSGIHC